MIDIINQDEIEQYLMEQGLSAEKTDSGIHYIIEHPGGDIKPSVADTVTCHYKGYFTNGSIFDSSYDRGQPISFPLSQVIKGWQQGIPLFGKGGKGTLLIPSKLAYGSYPPPGIPADAVMIFDIELIDF